MRQVMKGAPAFPLSRRSKCKQVSHQHDSSHRIDFSGRYPVVLGILGSKISLPTKIHKADPTTTGGNAPAPDGAPTTFVPEED